MSPLISPLLALKLVAMVTSLERPERRVRSVIYYQISTTGENFAKIGPVDPEIMCLKVCFKERNERLYTFIIVAFIIVLIYSAAKLPVCSQYLLTYLLIFAILKLRRYWTWTKATNENESADFAHFDHKIGCHGNVSYTTGKRGSDQ